MVTIKPTLTMRTKETEDEQELAIAIINEFNSIDFDKIIN